jgi:hypothetical protein
MSVVVARVVVRLQTRKLLLHVIQLASVLCTRVSVFMRCGVKLALQLKQRSTEVDISKTACCGIDAVWDIIRMHCDACVVSYI